MRRRGNTVFLLLFLLLLAIICVVYLATLPSPKNRPTTSRVATGSLDRRVDPLPEEERCAEAIESFVKVGREDLKRGKKAIRWYSNVPGEGLLAVELYFRPWEEVEKSKLPPSKVWWGYEVYRAEDGAKPPTPTKAPFLIHRERCLDETAIWCHVVYADGHVGARTVEGLKKAGITADPVVWDDHLGWKKLAKK